MTPIEDLHTLYVMPKKPKFIHPVRSLREIIREVNSSMSQAKFARLVGVSEPLINAIEAGQRRVTPFIARKISLATGSSAESLIQKRGKPETLYRLKYTAKAFQQWKAPTSDDQGKDLRKAALEEDCYRAVNSVDKLLKAAEEQGKFSQVHLDLSYWIKDVCPRYGLTTTYNRLMRESKKERN